jgi:exosortase E/protease (VPEID-CTERM system)
VKAGELRLGAWFALVVAEGLALGVTFDSEALANLPVGWWTAPLHLSGTLMPLAAAIGAGLILVCWARPGTFTFGFRAGRGVWLDALLQFVSFAILFALTGVLFSAGEGGDDFAHRHVGWLVGVWLVAVATTAITWLRIGLSLRTLRQVLGRRAGLLALACALGIVAYGVGRMAQGLWLPLRQATFVATSLALRALVDDPIVDASGFLLGHGDFVVEIAPQCSGYEGVGLSWVFLLTSLWLFRARLRFPQAYLLLLIGTVAPWLANVIRLATLVLLGSFVSPDMAIGAFHSYAGAIMFCIVALGIVWFALRTPWFAVDGHPDGPATNPAAPYLVPFLAMLLAGLVSRALSHDGHEPLGALRPIVGVVALVIFSRGYRALLVRPSWFALPAGLLCAGLWLAVDALGNAGQGAPAGGAGSLSGLIIRALVAVVVVPVVEELAFRGFLARRLTSREFDAVPGDRLSALAIVISSLAFGLLHQRVVAGTLAGLCYALVYRRRGQLADAIIAHAATNAALVVVAAATGRHDLWL